MGCCFSEPVDYNGEVNLFHFDLHRAVGKGAFGKVSRYLLLLPDPFTSCSINFPGAGRRAQTHQETLCPQIHRQITMHSTKGRCQHHPGASSSRRGSSPVPYAITHLISLNMSSRLITHLSSISVMLFRTMKTAFSSSTSCWEVT